MCGICCFFYKISGDDNTKSPPQVDKCRLHRRGPDSSDTLTVDISTDVQATFYGCTLHFQGTFTVQPIRDDRSNVLLWNGEIFGGIKVAKLENDGQVLLSLLALCRSPEELLTTMAQIRGPWAFVYWQSASQRLWFGRDVLGRRSLLYHISSDTGQLSLSSVCLDPLKPWVEVPAMGIYAVDFNHPSVSTCNDVLNKILCFPWVNPPRPSCTLGWGVPKGRVVNAADVMPFSGDANLQEQCWGGVPVQWEQLGVVAPLGVFNTTLPDGQEGTVVPGCSDQTADVVDMSRLKTCKDNDLSECPGSRTRSYIPSSLCDPQGQSMSLSVETSCANEHASPGVNQTDMTATPTTSCGDSHVTLELTEGTSGPLLKYATERQWGLSQNLLDVLSEAVRLRVQLQASRCHQCLAQNLCENRETEAALDKVGSIDITDTSCATESCANFDSATLRHSNNSLTNCAAFSGEHIHDNSNHGNHCHDNIDGNKATEMITSPCIHQSTPPRETNDASGKHGCHGSGHQDALSCHGNDYCGHARVAVLFSGGIDSLVLAALADRHVPLGEPIDLLNVAFEKQPQQQRTQKRQQTNRQMSSSQRFHVPDRITGRNGLSQLNCDRCWNFVEIDVTLQELQTARSSNVRHLIYPLQTILDDSIGCAIWFAARGRGLVTKATGERFEYASTARVVLVGMGADEQLAGYSRHRVKFQSGGWECLIYEVQMEIARISSRNLGRDDRVISDHAREARFPFLDENVVSFLNSLPLHEKADLSLPRGVGEKLLLRLLALRLGLARSAMLPKRAIQFGSRIAKMENRKEHASDTCDRLKDESNS